MICVMASKSVNQFFVYVNGDPDGHSVRLENVSSLSELLKEASDELDIEGKVIYTRHGTPVQCITDLDDGESVYVSCGEEFVLPREYAARNDHSVTMEQVQGQKWIRLNVGGKQFLTTQSTLTSKEPDSMLARMFADSNGVLVWQNATDDQGAYLIDRSPTYFEPILNYLRSGELVIDKDVNPLGVLVEAKFYGIMSLVDRLEAKIKEDEPASESTPLTRTCLIKKLMSTPPEWELRCQGVNLEGANLSKLDLRRVNFKYAVLRKANLTSANLSYCNFERADLSMAKLDGANLLGVKMLCANLEKASMHSCNFEDPAGTRANMEGANMKQVNLDGSHMAGVNLRVATLKNANLQNCDLRGAVLAGADLENCDLSGCDLQEANLRGANLKGAAFELMLNPVHMSQTVR